MPDYPISAGGKGKSGNRRHILLPGEQRAPDDLGPVTFVDLSGLGELTAPNGVPCVGLAIRDGADSRMILAVPAANLHNLLGQYFSNHGMKLVPIAEGNGKTNHAA